MKSDGKVLCGRCSALVPRSTATLATTSVTTAPLQPDWPYGYQCGGVSLQQTHLPLCQSCLTDLLIEQGEQVAAGQQAVLLERERLQQLQAGAQYGTEGVA